MFCSTLFLVGRVVECLAADAAATFFSLHVSLGISMEVHLMSPTAATCLFVDFAKC